MNMNNWKENEREDECSKDEMEPDGSHRPYRHY